MVTIVTGAQSTTNISQIRRKESLSRKEKAARAAKRGKIRSKARK